MRREKHMARLALVTLMLACVAASAQAQGETAAQNDASGARVALGQAAVALDAAGRTALAGRLLTTALSATPDAPLRNARFVITNRSPFFFTFVSGVATFYDAEGVRCGEGMFRLGVLAPNEEAETDAPGLRLTCAASSWRIVATNLVTRTPEATLPATTAEPAQLAPAGESRNPLPPLSIEINGTTLPIQPGNAVEVNINGQPVRIIVRPVAP